MDRVCDMAANYDIPILFHDGTPPYSLPSQIALLARRHPRTRIILGHCGLLEYWREAAEALDVAENLWGCLCGPHTAGMKHIIQRCDVTRLLWGSDFGFSFNNCFDYRFDVMKTLELDEPTRRAILQDNPARLLRTMKATEQ
jgi:hypothetical protein